MPFRPVQSEKLSAAVVRQVEELILRGILRPGERLPSERELSDRLGVSRPSLREAVADLSERGLLVARAGAGIFVTEALGSAFSETLVQLFARHDEAVFDYLDFRRDMEGLAAERAATLGTDTDLKVIDALFAQMEAAHGKRNPNDEARLDAGIPSCDHRGKPQRHDAAHDAVDVPVAARGRLLQPASDVQAAHHARGAAGSAPCHQ